MNAEAENALEDEAASGSENEAETESFWQPLLRVLFGDKSHRAKIIHNSHKANHGHCKTSPPGNP